MKGLLARLLTLVLVLGLLVSVLGGCGAPNPKESYPLESVNRDGNAESFVYRASEQTVTEAAEALQSQQTPDQVSAASDERMFLVYGDQVYHLQQDPDNAADTLVEVNSREYVRNNYDSGFLQTYLTARLIGELFDSARSTGSYRGYGSKDVYKPRQGAYRKPTDQDKKIAPPITVERQGLLTRRGKRGSGTVTGGDSVRDGNPAKGTINRNKGSVFDPPRTKIGRPKTRFGTGRIGRRGRR
ncbi:DUF4247 domain-containing protein [Paenibacillus albidus]|uniref:DUF4247 domain-containing protein n=1 Tax=Paenibacillus albidus TaxID=2041023 RepID=UPI001BE646CE|nr:DUF4247 domain-containing protein [Paenibacillus albidus]MBT2287881.1 DUF4247 domain-containing protein [Paenibacillus albidus]